MVCNEPFGFLLCQPLDFPCGANANLLLGEANKEFLEKASGYFSDSGCL
jgi:hypothetical protein